MMLLPYYRKTPEEVPFVYAKESSNGVFCAINPLHCACTTFDGQVQRTALPQTLPNRISSR